VQANTGRELKLAGFSCIEVAPALNFYLHMPFHDLPPFYEIVTGGVITVVIAFALAIQRYLANYSRKKRQGE
jgi:hypothetical protein